MKKAKALHRGAQVAACAVLWAACADVAPGRLQRSYLPSPRMREDLPGDSLIAQAARDTMFARRAARGCTGPDAGSGPDLLMRNGDGC